MSIPVYVRTNAAGEITDISSGVFLSNTDGWTLLEYTDDKYKNPDSSYVPKGIRGADGIYNYLMTDGAVVEKSAEQRAAESKSAAMCKTLHGLQGGVPFSEISITSKNILPYPFVSKTKTEKGISFTNNNDGSITADGTATDMVYSYMAIPLMLPSGTYTISDGAGAVSSDFYIQVYLYNAPYTTLATTTTNHAFTLAEATEVVFRLVAVKGAVLSGITVKPQLERGDTATDYEPPAGQEIMLIVNGEEYALTPDSNPYIVPNDIRQQDGTNNVSVSAGEVSVTGVRSSAVMNRVWKALDRACGEGLLRNSNFRINQREVSGTITDTGYFLDCWQLVSGSVTVNSDGTITLNGTIKQILENDPGENVTASASAGTAVYNSAAKTFMLLAAGQTISWAKLEYGDIATPYSAPEYTTELYRCRRYFQRFRNTDDYFVFFGTGLAFSASQGFAMVPLFAPLRSAEAHTAVLSGTLYCTNANAVGTTAIEITEITGVDVSEKAGTVNISFKTSGLTESTPLMIQFRDTSSYLDISSEL